MKFIELTDTNGKKIFVNMARVEYMEYSEHDKETMLVFVEKVPFPQFVKETPEQILKKIKECGK